MRWARLELARIAPPPPQDGVSAIPPPARNKSNIAFIGILLKFIW